jgi:hypothetical protein
MAEWKRYVNRTEAWAREVDDDSEDVVGSDGRTTAYRGDYVVNQSLRGSTYTFVVPRDVFATDWRLAEEVDASPATSETGQDELPGTVPPEPGEDASTGGDNGVENPNDVATLGQRADSTPAEGQDAPASQETTEDGGSAPPTPTASAPTSAASGDAATPAGNPPDVGSDTPPAMSPVSGTQTPPEPVAAPAGDAATEDTGDDVPVQEPTSEDPRVNAPTEAQPATTTPTQTADPSSEPGGPGTATAEETAGSDELTTRDDGGDAGAAPTPNEAATETTGNEGGKVRTLGAPADGNEATPGDGTDAGTSGKHSDSSEG